MKMISDEDGLSSSFGNTLIATPLKASVMSIICRGLGSTIETPLSALRRCFLHVGERAGFKNNIEA